MTEVSLAELRVFCVTVTGPWDWTDNGSCVPWEGKQLLAPHFGRSHAEQEQVWVNKHGQNDSAPLRGALRHALKASRNIEYNVVKPSYPWLCDFSFLRVEGFK